MSKEIAIISIMRYPNKHRPLPGTIYDLYSVILFCLNMGINNKDIYIILDHNDKPNSDNPKIENIDIITYITKNMNTYYINTARDYCLRISKIITDNPNIDKLVYYYSGHALKYSDVHPNGKNKEGFIVLSGNSKDKKDYDILNGKHIQNLFLKLKDNIKALCIFDCCFAETILCLSYYQTNSNNLKPYDSINRDKYKANIIAWMSSLSTQPSLASSNGSLFTKSIIRYLSSLNDPFDYNNNANFFKIRKPDYMLKYNQLPVLSISQSISKKVNKDIKLI